MTKYRLLGLRTVSSTPAWVSMLIGRKPTHRITGFGQLHVSASDLVFGNYSACLVATCAITGAACSQSCGLYVSGAYDLG
jgi:hypothetical protein